MEAVWKTKSIQPLKITLKENEQSKQPKSELGYDSRINSLRNCIDTINPEIWKKVRWFINNYDFIVEEPIINRAFYKYWEIVQTFNLLNPDFKKILCLAEAPGGFIQGTNYYYSKLPKPKQVDTGFDDDGFIQVQTKKKSSKLPLIYSISLNKNHSLYKNYNLPSYNSHVIKPNVKIIYGKDEKGDITNFQNIELFKNLVGTDKADFITADGGFDEGNDFNNKEQLHYTLFFTEIVYGLLFLKESGNFIIKFFDTFTDTSLDLLWLLANCFRELYIYKPYTSRPTNSEKYVICKGFLGITPELETDLLSIMSLGSSLPNAFRLFDETAIPERFKAMIFLMNQTILNGQCHFLQEAITLCYDAEFAKNFNDLKESMVVARKENFKKWKETFKLI